MHSNRFYCKVFLIILYNRTLLSQGGNCEIDGKFDGEDFQSLLSAMQVLGFTSDEQDTIFRILASGKLTHIVIDCGYSVMVN